VLDRTDFDRFGQKRSIGVLEIGAAYLVILVKVFDGRGLPAFGYGSPVDEFQNVRVHSALDGECLRVFVYGGNDAMIRHEQSFWSVSDAGAVRRGLRGRRRRCCLRDGVIAEQCTKTKHQRGGEVLGWSSHKLAGLLGITAV